MVKRPRRDHSPPCKAAIALAAIQGELTITELAQKFDVHANQLAQWKTQMLERAADVFQAGNSPRAQLVDIKRLLEVVNDLEGFLGIAITSDDAIKISDVIYSPSSITFRKPKINGRREHFKQDHIDALVTASGALT